MHFNHNTLISLEDVTFSYSNLPIFQHVDFKVQRHEIIGISGDNGKGKTTLFRLLMEELKPTHGMIKRQEYVNVALLAQNDRDIAAGSILTVEEFLCMHVVSHEIAKRRKHALRYLQPYFDKYQINDIKKRQLKYLSGGQLQRVMLIKAVLLQCDVLLLDEPLTALDEYMQKQVLSFIHDMKKEGITIIVILHDMHILKTLCDRVYVLENYQLKELA